MPLLLPTDPQFPEDAGADHVVAMPAELGGTLRRLLPTGYTVPTASAIGAGA